MLKNKAALFADTSLKLRRLGKGKTGSTSAGSRLGITKRERPLAPDEFKNYAAVLKQLRRAGLTSNDLQPPRPRFSA